MSNAAAGIVDALTRASRVDRLRKGEVTKVETGLTGPDLVTVATRRMPILLDTGGTVAVGDIVLWVDGPDPVALGKLQDT